MLDFWKLGITEGNETELEVNSKYVNQKEARIGQRANGVIMTKGNTSEFGNGILEMELRTKQEV